MPRTDRFLARLGSRKLKAVPFDFRHHHPDQAPSLSSRLSVSSTTHNPLTEHHPGFIRAVSSGCGLVSTPPTRHVTPGMSRAQQDQFIDDDEEETCPLCVEEFDITDKGFRPCPCGYQVGVCSVNHQNSKWELTNLTDMPILLP